MSITPDTIIEINNKQNFKIRKCQNANDVLSPITLHYEISNIINEILNDKLHTYEKNIIDNVLLQLNNNISSEYWYENKLNSYPENSLSFDFFVINEKNEIIDIHTTMIWKKRDKEYIILDPNKKEYSERIINILNEKYSCYGKFTHMNIQNAEGKINLCNDINKRDCTDLSIKNSFILNEIHKICNEIEKIEKYLINKSTNINKNIKKIDDCYTSEDYIPFNNTSIKDQHSTDKNMRDNFETYVKNNSKNISSKFPDGIKCLKCNALVEVANVMDFIKKEEEIINNKLQTQLNIILKK